VDINLEEFELLMEFKWTGNSEFHVRKSEEALEELTQFSFPNNLKCYKDPLKKTIIAMKIWRAQWAHHHSDDDDI
jgi:hypothetical protein